jgi:hypothetical protein
MHFFIAPLNPNPDYGWSYGMGGGCKKNARILKESAASLLPD